MTVDPCCYLCGCQRALFKPRAVGARATICACEACARRYSLRMPLERERMQTYAANPEPTTQPILDPENWTLEG